jgi:hypothetical protein
MLREVAALDLIVPYETFDGDQNYAAWKHCRGIRFRRGEHVLIRVLRSAAKDMVCADSFTRTLQSKRRAKGSLSM